MTTANARLNAQNERNTQIKVLAMKYAIDAKSDGEAPDVLIARAQAIFEFMKDDAPVNSLEVVKSFPGA
jgi:hypothetical protein